MPIFRLQAALQDESGMARDQYVNSIYVNSVSPTPTSLATWASAFGSFYNTLATYLSPVIHYEGHTVKVYLVGAPLESPPVHTQPFITGTTTGTSLPLEVACCLSFKGVLHEGWNKQSTRGRIYVGPLNTTCSAAETGGKPIPGMAFRTAACGAASTMAAAIVGDAGKWGVYSKLHAAITPIIQVSMDNEWDTQRSRGSRADSKLTVAIP